MFCADYTFKANRENIALDEALLDSAEEGGTGETLRFWEPSEYAVIVGYANRVAAEVNLAYCREAGIPTLRRCTGGGTVLQGPGVLNYSLVLRIDPAGPTKNITSTNHFVMDRQREALAKLLKQDVQVCGHTDLALHGLKFSGNAQRRKLSYLIFHGVFLLALDLEQVEKTLRMPSRQPAYRRNRSHANFLINLDCSAVDLKSALVRAWNAVEPLNEIPRQRVDKLVCEKYSRDDWNNKF